MALPSTGPISLSEINTELGRSSSSTISLNSAEAGTYGAINITSTSRPNRSTPNSMSEWRGYDHTVNQTTYANGHNCDAFTNLICYISTGLFGIQNNTTIMYVISGTSMVPIANGNYTVLLFDGTYEVVVSGGSGVITSNTQCTGGGGFF